jgi:hypothetical protein
LVRWMMVRKQKICAYAVHCAPGSVSKSETSARVQRSPGQNQKQHSEQEAFEACPEPVISSWLSAVPTRRPRLGAAVQQCHCPLIFQFRRVLQNRNST